MYFEKMKTQGGLFVYGASDGMGGLCCGVCICLCMGWGVGGKVVVGD